MVRTLLLLITLLPLSALELPYLFSSNMVLQRDLANPVWGWDSPGATITVDFSGQSKTATANENGKWTLKLDALPANPTPQNMSISSSNGAKVDLTNILVGDVWICSGQSNMEWNLKQSLNPELEIKNANHPQLRLFDVAGHTTSAVPQKRLTQPASWNPCVSETAAGFSAVGYHFGRELLQTGVPVGLIGTNWGGTRIEPWTPNSGFASQPELKSVLDGNARHSLSSPEGKNAWNAYLAQLAQYQSALADSVTKNLPIPSPPAAPGISHQEPLSIYNAMVAPLVGYGVRGAIWYQGESNSGEGMVYLPKMKALVEGWRKEWNQPADFPFYFYVVKLAAFMDVNSQPAGGDGFARIRVAQDRIQDLPHTGVASAIDIGNGKDIHPKNKQDVGKRLALLALRDVHKKEVVAAGPTFKSMEINGSVATISFSNVGSGLMTARKKGLDAPLENQDPLVEHFAICGADQQWHWAQAIIAGDTVQVSAEAVTEPVAVRFAYTSNPEKFNFYNKEGLPAIPFRTDNWNP